jgi:oligopeptide/dipeptide ABC transporter ATP-binding protein
MPPLLEVQSLKTWFHTDDGVIRAVDDITFHIDEGEILGLVGESGCGKSVTSLSILRLVSPPGRVAGGRIVFKGTDLLKLSEKEMQKIRGNEISMIFQEPMTSLNPVFTVGDQIAEAIVLHQKKSKKDAMTEVVRLLDEVQIPDARRRAGDYPHQLSGGMRQRVMIAMALSCGPSLLIADEPTTALDVTIQAQILDILRRLQRERRLSVLLITHDLGVIAEVAGRVAVMYAGKVVEEATAKQLYKAPKHPYTQGLLRSIPNIDRELRVAGKAHRLTTIEGVVPDLLELPPGCSFRPRCSEAVKLMPRCDQKMPDLLPIAPGHTARCYLYE